MTPSLVIPDDNVGADASNNTDLDTFSSGTDVFFKFGDLVNADNDADSEFVVVEFNAIVDNSAGNDNGDTRSNDFNALVDGIVEDTSNPIDLLIREPDLSNITKVALPTTGDAGDTITFTLSYSNTGTTNAFDIRLLDSVPADYLVDLASVSVMLGSGATGFTDNSTGNDVDVMIDDIPVGGTVQITYEADLLTAVEAADVIQNTACVDYTSLPGSGTSPNPTGSTVPGATGAVDGERDGSGSQNDLSHCDTADVTINSPTIGKTLDGTSIVNADNANNQAVIGETIQYSVSLTIPEGTITAAEIVDTLDPGMVFVRFDSIATSAGVTSSTGSIDLNDASSFAPNVAGSVLTWDLGTLTNSNSSNANDETIDITYTVRVDNVASNQGEAIGTMLNNSATFRWTEDGNATTAGPASAADVEVIEPNLDVAKSVMPNPVDAGDSVTYTITVSHNADSDTSAYDVVFSDPIPTDLTISSFTAIHSTDGDITAIFQQSGNTIETIPGSSFDLDPTETVIVTVDATTNPGLVIGGPLTNTASIEWTSIDGTDSNERDGSGGVDDYADSGSTNLQITPPGVSKSLVSTSINDANNDDTEVTIGETIQYEVAFTVPEGTLENAHLFDTLDPGLSFVSLDSLIVESGGGPTSGVTTDVGAGDFSDLASFAPTVMGTTLDFDFGTIANSTSGDGQAETITLRYTVRVANLASSQTESDTMLGNEARLEWDFGGMTTSSTSASAPDVEVIEPVLDVTKTIDDDTPRLGQVVNYSVQVVHALASDADAHDVIFSDSLPSGMTLSLGSIMVAGATLNANTSAGNNVNLSFDEIPLGSSATITYSATISSNPADIGALLNNTAAIDWTSLPGSDANERDGSDGFGGALNDYAVTSLESATITQPILNAAKEYVSLTPNATTPDNFDLAVRAVVQNDGNVDFTNISLVEDLASHFGGIFVGVTPPSTVDVTGLTNGGTAPNLNAMWDGNLSSGGQTDLFDAASGLLRPGESIAVEFIVEIDPDAVTFATPLENQIEASAEFMDDGMTNSIMDLSDDGDDPSSTNPGFPGDTGGMDDPNPLWIPDVSLAKSVFGTPVQLANGNYSVAYELTYKNVGTVDLENLQITEDLTGEFGTGVFVGLTAPPTIVSGPTLPGSSAPNFAIPAWDGNLGGSGNQQIWDGGSGFLVPGDEITLRFTIEVDPDFGGTSSALDNQAEASGTPLDAGGNPLPSGNVIDDSDSGTDPSSTNPGAAGDMMTSDDPTPLELPEISTVKRVSGDFVDNGDGTFTIPLELLTENIGTVDLNNPTLVDHIQSQWGAAFDRVTNVMLDASGITGGVAPTINGSWDGTDASSLIAGGSLAAGDFFAVTFDVIVNGTGLAANSPMTNQSTATGDAANGSGIVSDLSDDGVNVHGDNATFPGDDGMGGTDDPTPIQIPQIGLAKSVVGSPTQLATGNWSVDFELILQNTGSVDLTNLQISEDLEAEFGAGIFVGVIAPPTMTAGPTDAASLSPNAGTLGRWRWRFAGYRSFRRHQRPSRAGRRDHHPIHHRSRS